ncbi:rhodanese-like domain-containing protein [Muricauda sp. CAU 1633]|uniref:rhodanese-like domain-containing protein n=1 Tax=Allomuricauda sp. CAU 1633 TaxID=2816036 RepID=UPI001A8F5C83|nr:rhodanese-like domain-containing protein [Muricauda sp. CAU 1633]MBO0321418.1 rhodanese-like domain-containing protein [Muricauda sp. CAU 1633]
MRLLLLLFLFLTLGVASCAQQSIPEVLKQLNDGTVDYISVENLHEMEAPLLLDTREKEEFEVSHLKSSIWVGYTEFDLNKVLQELSNKEKPIVVYCSIGVRSEDIGEQLKNAGYTNVLNLYGGIFEWKNKGYPVYDENEHKTEKVHPYSRYWGRFLTNAEKVYGKQ